MVSLETSKTPRGGFSFETINQANDEFIEQATSSHTNLLMPNNNAPNDNIPLTADVEPSFKQIGTTWAIVLQILTVVILETGVFVIPIICGQDDESCPQFKGFDLAVFVHGAFWFLKYMFDRFYQYHHMKSRRNGYLEFYRITRFIRSLPFLIISASNSILIILIKLLDKYCPDNKCTSANLTKQNFLQIFVSLETIILLPILIKYLHLTIKFNKSKKSPDIVKEMDRPLFLPSQLKDLGYKDSTYLSNILEYQADMIRYYQERDNTLTRKLHQLTNSTEAAEGIN